MYRISELNIYPIKSLSGIRIESGELTDRGLRFDRRYMLIDAKNRFLSQRTVPKMALLQPVISAGRLFVYEKRKAHDVLELELEPQAGQLCTVALFKEQTQGWLVGGPANAWFSEKLGVDCRLLYMPDAVQRAVDRAFARQGALTAFSDGYPLLMIGAASLADLNQRLWLPLPMNRFRPNIVFSGGQPFEEDRMKAFRVNGIDFFAVKPCSRCVMTTIDQETAEKQEEPLPTLSEYRRIGHRLLFGQNVLFNRPGRIRVGDPMTVIEWQPHLFESKN